MNIKQLIKRKNFPKLALVIEGAAAGYGCYHFIGCASGTCPITGNPYVSTMYGGLMGFLLGTIREG
jgi:hypothetical protein